MIRDKYIIVTTLCNKEEVKNVEEITPLDFDHQGNMDDWLIIEKIEDVVVGTSIPYNYEKSRF